VLKPDTESFANAPFEGVGLAEGNSS